MDSAPSTKSAAASTPKLSSTIKTPPGIPFDVKSVVMKLLLSRRTSPPPGRATLERGADATARGGSGVVVEGDSWGDNQGDAGRAECAIYGWGRMSAWSDDDNDGPTEVQSVQFLAEGGYNRLWFVTTSSGTQTQSTGAAARRFILRIPNKDALLPHQILNEVAFLQYVGMELPRIPVPKVYAFDAGTSLVGVPFIAEEFVKGLRLDEAWGRYSGDEKEIVARRLAEIIVDMATTSFPGIGGLTLQHQLGPTVEGIKLVGGRGQFHSHDCYNIGPYFSMEEYVIACYDKEIYYYTHAPKSVIDNDLFEHTSLQDFVQSLHETKNLVLNNDSAFPTTEPFVLVHGDFHGRNILVIGTEIAAVVDWEFAGAYPLSELLGDDGIEFVEFDDTPRMKENSKWCTRILRHVKQMVQDLGWSKRDERLLLEGRNEALQWARCEMIPRDCF